jgi:hypothetical protein
MWIVIEGLAGSGKSWLQSRLIREEWRRGATVWANYKLMFSESNDDVHRFNLLDEIFHLTKAVIGIDEVQDLAGHWVSIPVSFRNKIAHHRHHHLDVYSNTQDFNDLHVELRRNVHEIYRCQSLFRFPRKDRVKPLLQIVRVIKKVRQITNDTDRINFKKIGRQKFYFISRLWTREYYDTYADIDFTRFVCKLECEQKKGQKKPEWIMKIYDRDMIANGKARL